MYLLRRIIPVLSSAWVTAMLAMLAWYPHVLQWLSREAHVGSVTLGIVLGLSWAVAALSMIAIGAGHPVLSRIRFFVFPFLLIGSSFTLLTFLDRALWVFAVVFGTGIMLWLWYESLYLFWQQPQWYQPYTLQRLSSFLYVVLFFIFDLALSGLYVYLQMRFWGVAAVLAFVCLLLLADAFSLAQMPRAQAFLAAALGAFAAAELFLAVSYLPTHPVVMATLMAVFLYLWLGLGKLWGQNSCTRPQVAPYVAVSASGFLITIVSAFWII